MLINTYKLFEKIKHTEKSEADAYTSYVFLGNEEENTINKNIENKVYQTEVYNGAIWYTYPSKRSI